MSERPIFIVGCPRSGTTVLRDLLRSHPRLTFPRESCGLPGLHRLHGDPRSDREARLLASDFLDSHAVREWNLSLRSTDLEQGRSFTAVIAPVYEEWARGQGKPRWGDKTPQHVLAIPLLARLFPGAQFVHILRDGRDVALSLAGELWGQKSTYTGARYWRRCVETGLEDGRALGSGRYHELAYEDLLATPEPVLRSLCAFLGESFDEVLLQPSRIPRPDAQPLQWDDRFDRQLDASSVARWRTEMPVADEIVFESVAGDLLRRLGYVTNGVSRPIGRVERARWETRDLAGKVHWRLTAWDRLPRARTSLLRTRSRVLRRLGRTAAP